MEEIYAFDFDGTLTRRDTLPEFIRFARGGVLMAAGFMLLSPLIVLMKLRLYPNYKAKQRLFSLFFRGMEIEQFDALCARFTAERSDLLRPEGIKTMKKAQEEGKTVAVVSASIDNWVAPFFPGVTVIGTRIEVKDGLITGRFLTPNCYGREKVNRLRAVFPDRQSYRLTAFGDSRGDRELLAFADETHYKPFR